MVAKSNLDCILFPAKVRAGKDLKSQLRREREAVQRHVDKNAEQEALGDRALGRRTVDDVLRSSEPRLDP